MRGAGAILRLRLSTIPRLQPRSPLSRSAGAGPGVRAALTFPLAAFLFHKGSGRGRWDSYGCNTIHDQPGASGTATAEIIEDDLPDAHAFDALAVSSAGARHTGVEAPLRGAVVPLRLDTRRSDADRLLIPILSVITGYQTSLLSLTGCFDPFQTLSARHSDQGANLSLLSLLES